jgi:hypothetical protein
MARLPLGLWTPHHDLQSLQSLVATADLAAIFGALVEMGWIDATVAIDSTYVKAHRSAHGGKGGRRRRPSVFPAVVRPQKSMF